MPRCRGGDEKGCSRLESLRLDLFGDSQDAEALKETLKNILAEHDAAIVG